MTLGSVWVLHVDMDQFIAAVELLRHPELAGRPVVVGGAGDPTQRSVVATASYEARAFGVHSGMPMKMALRKCPDAVFLPADNAAYEQASVEIQSVLRSFDVVVEVLGWDEAFLGAEVEDPESLARQIQAAVLDRHPAALLDRHRRQHPAGQARHRVRQAGRRLPVDRPRTGRP